MFRHFKAHLSLPSSSPPCLYHYLYLSLYLIYRSCISVSLSLTLSLQLIHFVRVVSRIMGTGKFQFISCARPFDWTGDKRVIIWLAGWDLHSWDGHFAAAAAPCFVIHFCWHQSASFCFMSEVSCSPTTSAATGCSVRSETKAFANPRGLQCTSVGLHVFHSEELRETGVWLDVRRAYHISHNITINIVFNRMYCWFYLHKRR